MENIQDWINSAVLLFLSVAYFSQDRHLKYMKTAIEIINPEKIKSAQEIIDKGKEYEMKFTLNKKIDEITKKSWDKNQEMNKEFHNMFNELISIPFGIMKSMTLEEREKHLKYYPKCEKMLREALNAYDEGKFPSGQEKESNTV